MKCQTVKQYYLMLLCISNTKQMENTYELYYTEKHVQIGLFLEQIAIRRDVMYIISLH